MSLSGSRQAELARQAKERLRLQQLREQSRSLVESCQATIRGVTDMAVQQLTAKDFKTIKQDLETVSGRIDSEPDAAFKAIKKSQAQLNKVLSTAEVAAKKWSKQQAQANAQLRVLQQNFEVEKKVSNQAGQKVLGQLDQKIAQAKLLCKQGNYKELKTVCTKAETVVKEASQASFDETVRRKVVGGLISTLMNMGFVVDSPSLHGDDPAKAVVKLTGRMPSGRRATFEVNLDGKMEFDFDGYQGKACAKDLDSISQTLQDQMDIKLGSAQITWKNPDKIAKGARDLPAGLNRTNR